MKENQALLKDLRLEKDKNHHTQQLYNNLILNEKYYHEKNQHSHEEMDSLKNELKTIKQQFERLTREHVETIERHDQEKHEYREREQRFQEEAQHLKRDLGLELFRKQDAEKKVRMLEDKLRNEQTQYQKVQYDFIKTNHDLQTLQAKYDALKMQIKEMHQNEKNTPGHKLDAKTSTTTINEEQLITSKPKKRSTRGKRRTNDQVIIDSYDEFYSFYF